jgi:hypothetical protein
MDASPASAAAAAVGRCVECRGDIAVPATYTHGDHIRCGSCGTHHKVLRSPTFRLVLTDVTRLQETLRQLETRLDRRQDELRGARGSLGMGVFGLSLGVIWLLFQIGLRNRAFEVSLFVEGAGLAVVTGVLLEVVNYFFLAKRHRMEKLSEEIADLRREGLELRRKIREAQRS